MREEELSKSALRPLYTLIPGLLTTTLGPIRPVVRRACVGGVGTGDTVAGSADWGDTTGALNAPFWVTGEIGTGDGGETSRGFNPVFSDGKLPIWSIRGNKYLWKSKKSLKLEAQSYYKHRFTALTGSLADVEAK